MLVKTVLLYVEWSPHYNAPKMWGSFCPPGTLTPLQMWQNRKKR